MQRIAVFTLGALCLLLSPFTIAAKLAIVIDDLGYNSMPVALSALPAQISLSILPDTPFDIATAELAHQQQRDVLLHMPMQPQGAAPLEPLTLTNQMPEETFKQTLRHALLRVPHAVAVNNHMGSALTQDVTRMDWVMTVLAEQGLGFLDSRTSVHSVAEQRAHVFQLSTLRRHIFLDHFRTQEFVTQQLKMAVKRAQRHGYAVAIGHPYPVTLSTLQQQLPLLDTDVELVPLSALF
ncbi:divergent polysaccharide deacetylase family protein [Photobacterium sanguinicancri]|uniref:Divergent polysaccharide deacetylase family protein n=1 Tax=Photobacterium sanguinicancri TaxID=875932 RepID=A0AAW7Y454_9GAMM|nr:divergent polysaccharide deacetylase family protein [Photobacterium sanguinicancri]MDO6543129.1 divergent polysaccharide deacetylase family protein [Photobacterium sanguinicancri]